MSLIAYVKFTALYFNLSGSYIFVKELFSFTSVNPLKIYEMEIFSTWLVSYCFHPQIIINANIFLISVLSQI